MVVLTAFRRGSHAVCVFVDCRSVGFPHRDRTPFRTRFGPAAELVGDDRAEETPVPIPNTEVKLGPPMILLCGKVGYRRLFEPLQGNLEGLFSCAASGRPHLDGLFRVLSGAGDAPELLIGPGRRTKLPRVSGGRSEVEHSSDLGVEPRVCRGAGVHESELEFDSHRSQSALRSSHSRPISSASSPSDRPWSCRCVRGRRVQPGRPFEARRDRSGRLPGRTSSVRRRMLVVRVARRRFA